MVDEPVDQGGRAGGVGEHRVPVPKREIGRQKDGTLFIPAAHHLEEEIGRAVVVGQVPVYSAKTSAPSCC